MRVKVNTTNLLQEEENLQKIHEKHSQKTPDS